MTRRLVAVHIAEAIGEHDPHWHWAAAISHGPTGSTFKSESGHTGKCCASTALHHYEPVRLLWNTRIEKLPVSLPVDSWHATSI